MENLSTIMVGCPTLRHWSEVTARFIDMKKKKERDFPLTSESRPAAAKIEILKFSRQSNPNDNICHNESKYVSFSMSFAC